MESGVAGKILAGKDSNFSSCPWNTLPPSRPGIRSPAAAGIPGLSREVEAVVCGERRRTNLCGKWCSAVLGYEVVVWFMYEARLEYKV